MICLTMSPKSKDYISEYSIFFADTSSNRFITYFDHDLAECIGDR